MLILKPQKDIARKENYWPITLMSIDINVFNKIVPDLIQLHIKRIIGYDPVGFILEFSSIVQHL